MGLGATRTVAGWSSLQRELPGDSPIGDFLAQGQGEALARRCLQAAGELHAGRSLRSRKRRAVFLWRCLRHARALDRWSRADGNPLLAAALADRPALLAIVEHPYLHAQWSVARRMAAVEAHYRAVAAGRELLAFPAARCISLCDAGGVPANMRLTLEKPEWFRWEGEVALSLFENDTRLYSLAFSLAMEDSEVIAQIGAIKGGTGGLLDIYRRLTRQLHGMRPRDFLFCAFRLLCRELQIARIWGIADRARLHRSELFGGRVRVIADYDAIWRGYGGTDLGNGFFDVPLPVAYRGYDQIPARKRSQYRRRYEMLDALAGQLRCWNPGTSIAGGAVDQSARNHK